MTNPCAKDQTREKLGRLEGEARKQALLEMLRLWYPGFDFWQSREFPLEVLLRDATGKVILDSGDPGAGAFFREAPGEIDLVPAGGFWGREKTTLFADLGAMVNSVTPGEYTMIVKLHGTRRIGSDIWETWTSQEVKLKVVATKEEVQDILREAASKELPKHKWVLGHHLVGKDIKSELLKKKLSAEAYSTVVLHCFLSETIKAGDVAKAPVDLLHHVPDHLAPLPDAFRVEVLYAKGKKEEAETLRKRILEKHPGAWSLVPNAKDGTGILTRLIEERTAK